MITKLANTWDEFYNPERNKIYSFTVHPKPERWVHSLTCSERTAKALDERNAWAEQWPQHCEVCEGTGITVFHDSVPYGMGNCTMTTEEPCEVCAGYCPRCHYHFPEPREYGFSWNRHKEQPDLEYDTFWEEERPCPECGFRWDDRKPEVPECYCWEVQYE